MPRTIHISKDLGLGPFPMDEKDPQVKTHRYRFAGRLDLHQFSVTMKKSARQGHHLHITRSKKPPATSSPLCFSRAP